MEIALCFIQLTVAAVPSEADAPARGSERVVHRFDFDERGLGNLEPHPMYWERLPHDRFPSFAAAEFDHSVGRSAPPSFHLASDGRDIAFAYTGPHAHVESGQRFRIEGFVRADRLIHARACLSAAYRRKDGTTLLDTLVRSRFIDGGSDEWEAVELYLQQAPAQAEAIVLTAWVLQEATWDAGTRSTRNIDRVDVDGGAWFDDIVVVALPRIGVHVADGLNVLTQDDRAELQVVVDDMQLHELDLLLTILDAADEIQREIRLSKENFTRGLCRVSLSALPPGVYSATLRVTYQDQLIDARTTRFGILAPLPGGRRTGAQRFGIALRPGERLRAQDDTKLLTHQFVRAAKLPLWTGGTSEGTDPGGEQESELLLELMKRSFDITAVLLSRGATSAPADVTSALEGLGPAPAQWESEVSATAAKYAGAIRWWQIGLDGSVLGTRAAALDAALDQVRSVLDRYALAPQLAAAWSAHEEFAGAYPRIDGVTLTLNAGMETALASAIAEHRSGGLDRVSVFAEPLPADRYLRLPRMQEWIKRVLTARHAGADTVYVPQTWTVRSSYEGLVSEPTEEFILLRTLAGMVGDADPGPQVNLGNGITCLTFYSNEAAVLALWDNAAPPGGREAMLDLGRATHVVDPWGNRSPLLRHSDGRHSVRLSQMPVLIGGVERWLIDLLTAVRVEPARATPGAEAAHHVLRIDYKGEKPVSASVRVVTPPSWRASPASFDASISRSEPFDMPFELRRPHNEPAGMRQIIAELRTEHPAYTLQIPLPFEIALEDVEVRGQALLVGDELILRHSVRNTGSQQLHLRSAAAVPGRQRQYRPIVNLEPGDAETVEYRFRDGAPLSDKRIYLTLRELNDGPRSHTLEIAVP